MNRETHQQRRGSVPHIPSNLRIRRPRTQSYGAIIAGDALPDEGLEGRDIFEQGSRQGTTQTAQAEQQTRPALNERRHSARRMGAVEALAMSDRIAAANRSALEPTDDANTSNGALNVPSARERPRLGVRLASQANALPSLAEVTSPVESSGIAEQSEPASTAQRGSSGGVKEADYFPSSSSRGIGAAPPLASSSARPGLVATASAPPEDLPNPLKGTDVSTSQDDSAVTSGKLRRLHSDVSIPTPLSEEGRSIENSDHHAAEVADYLDVIDAEVGALSYLTNVQNSIFVPNIPALYDRRPIHDLPRTRRRGATITSLAKRTSRRASTAGSEGIQSQRRESHDRQSITSDLELAGDPKVGKDGRASAMGRGRPPSVLSRVASYVPGRKKEEEIELDQHIKEWQDMDDEERNELDEHVRMVLSKRSKFRRGAKGFWAFVKTPMGFIMTLYGFLITFWGTAIMLFIWNWIHVGERKRYWIEICDQILCALFAAVGLGFAPFRAVDTYRMIWIAKMHYRTWERRKKLGLEDLQDSNDLPRPQEDGSNQVSRITTAAQSDSGVVHSFQDDSVRDDDDVEKQAKEKENAPRHWWDFRSSKPKGGTESLLSPQTSQGLNQQSKDDSQPNEDPTGKTGDPRRTNPSRPVMKRNDSLQSELVKEREDVVVLTKEEQAILTYHQRKFHASHTFYRFHETATHRAFPLDLMITIVCLLDCHSLFQGALGGCTWGIKYTHRPTALTATLITCSLSCNAVAGLLIYIGGRKTKKREEVERRLRIALERMALAKIERRRARGELPERQPGEQSKGTDSDTSGEPEKNEAKEEYEEAIDAAARQTEEADQAIYDDDTEEVERTLEKHVRPSS